MNSTVFPQSAKQQIKLLYTVQGLTRTAIRAMLLLWRRSIHVYRDKGLGDVLMCTPALRAIKQANRNCKVICYTDMPDLVRGLPYIVDVHASDQRPAHTLDLGYEGEGVPRRHLAKIIAERAGVRLKDVRPDCVVDAVRIQKFREAWRAYPRPHILVQRRASALSC